MTAKMIIGSEEWFSLPELGIPAIKARIDTGARTSSIHAFNIRSFQRDDEDWVRFELHPLQRDKRNVIQCEHRIVDRRAVKSSSGQSELRYVIRSTIEADDRRWDVELTLTNRDSMGYRMLLGREAMLGRMVVDPSLKFTLGRVGKLQLRAIYGSH